MGGDLVLPVKSTSKVSYMESNASEELRNLLTILFYKKQFFLWTLLSCLAVTLVLFLLSPKYYSGEFSVLVRASELDTSRILPDTGVFLQPQAVNMEILTNEQNFILSDAVLSEVNRRLADEYPNLSFSPLAYGPYLLKKIYSFVSLVNTTFFSDEHVTEVSIYEKNNILRELIEPMPVIGTHTINVVITFYNVEILDYLQKTLLAVYLETRGALVTTEDTLKIYENDVEKAHKEWSLLRDEKAKFQITYSLYSVEKQKKSKLEQLLAIDKKIAEININLIEQRGQLVFIEQMSNILGVRPGSLHENKTIAELESQIALLEVRRSELLSDYLPASEAVKRVEYALTKLMARYKSILQASISSRIHDSSTRLGALQDEKDRIIEELNYLEDKNRIMSDFSQRTILAASAYQTFSNKLSEIKLQKLLSTSSAQTLSILRDPYVNPVPTWPNILLLVGLATMLGSFLGLIGVYLSYYYEDIVLQPADLGFTHLPVGGIFIKKTDLTSLGHE